MGEQPEEPKVKLTVWQSAAVVCQCCRLHDNNPSKCSAYNQYVGRKQDANECKKFIRTK